MFSQLRAWLGYGKLPLPASSGRSDWTSAERKEARKQIASEELDAWRSDGGNPPETLPRHAASESTAEPAPVIETEEQARRRLLEGLPRRPTHRPPDPPHARQINHRRWEDRAAVVLAHDLLPDLALTKITMPRLDGLTAAHEILKGRAVLSRRIPLRHGDGGGGTRKLPRSEK